MNGFTATEIFPYIPSKIADEAFLPSTLTEKPFSGTTLGELDDESDPDESEKIRIAIRSDRNSFQTCL